MLRKFKSGLLCAGLLFSASCLAINHNLAPGLGIDYELIPNIPNEFTNVWFWTINATCSVNAEDNSDEILVEALTKTGKINGRTISQGDALTLSVCAGDKLKISADSGAKVRLTNHGKNTVRINCVV